ncbi:MAG: DUF177 domain-containing protein [Rhodobacteraceae bacterium]|nr:DUF177 domain-containing protein [Paracoccaceae bacterium]
MSVNRLVRLATLDAGRPHDVTYIATGEECRKGAVLLGIPALAKLRVTGSLTPKGKTDWLLKAHLGATVTQNCVVTLELVKTRLDMDLVRHFLARWTEPEADSETEMSADVSTDPLPDELDIASVAFEEISLAIPTYPRIAGAEFDYFSAAPDGITPLSDEDLKPFAALKVLRNRMKNRAKRS